MKLYFVRHGRTVWNQEGRFQGASGDSPLLPESIDTLKQLGQYLKDVPFDQIYSSDLPRAVKSAEISPKSTQDTCPLESVSNLREWQLGKLEGFENRNLGSYLPATNQSFFDLILLNLTLKCLEPNPSIAPPQRTIQFINH